MKELKDKFSNKMVWVCALGYFVDVYDLVLFGVVRVPSLRAIGILESDFQIASAHLLNYQMAGLLLGGFIWGILGDKFGRTKILFASIFTYSIANVLNAFVTDLEFYACLRFLAGFGLAGELGVAMTLVAELLPQKNRGYGTTIVGFAGGLGGICAALLGVQLSWNHSYLIGGLLGLVLLITRLRATESLIFLNAKTSISFAGNLKLIFMSWERLKKYMLLVIIGMPIWYVAGILMFYSPEFAQALNITSPVLAGYAIVWNYCGSLIGDFFGGILSQKLQSRKSAILFFQLILLFSTPIYFFLIQNTSAAMFYFVCFLLGIGNGYWALLITMAAEQFGTNIRATVATSVPNLVRSTVIPMGLIFMSGKMYFGIIQSGFILGVSCIALALISQLPLSDTFHKDLNYIDK